MALGGGVALMDTYGRTLGSIGVAGDTSCTNHNVAWTLRNLLSLDYVPNGIHPDISRPDNILYEDDAQALSPTDNARNFTHPLCSTNEKTQTQSLQITAH